MKKRCLSRYNSPCIHANLQIVVVIYVAALLSQSSRFVEFDFEPVNVTSRVHPPTNVTGCQYTLTPFIGRHQQVGTKFDAAQLEDVGRVRPWLGLGRLEIRLMRLFGANYWRVQLYLYCQLSHCPVTSSQHYNRN